MTRISLILFIVFSLFSTACYPVRQTVVVGQPGVVYRSPNQNPRGNSATVTVSNYVAGASLDVMVGGTLVLKDLKPGETKEVSFFCNQGLITFSVGDSRRRSGSNTQFELSAKAHTNGTLRGVARGAPRVMLNCNASQSRPTHRSFRWDVRQVEALTELPGVSTDTTG